MKCQLLLHVTFQTATLNMCMYTHNGLPVTNINALSTLTHLADNITTFMCQLSRNSGTLNLLGP
jgi:hypothetical protein